MVDPEDAVRGVVSALKGVYREVSDEVVVVAVGQATAERVARTTDDLVLEALGQEELVFVGRLYGPEERWDTVGLATSGADSPFWDS
jgi:hypothetical protein